MNDNVESIEEISAEMVSLAIKAGRRASYDLKHATAFIDDPEVSKMFNERAGMWLDLFKIDSGMKDYRHSLHIEINELKSEVKRLEKLLDDNNIIDHNRLPF